MLLLGIILFIYIYAVPIIPIYTIHILALISIIYLLFYWKDLLKYIKESKIYFFVASILLSILYICLMYNFNEFLKAYIIVVENIPISIAIYIYISKKNIKIDKVLDILIIVAFVQSVLAILAFTIKPIQQFFLDILQYTNQDYNGILQSISNHRMYGYSSNLTFSTPIVQVLIAFISLQKFINTKKIIYILPIPLIIFSAIINARTSIIIIVLGVLAIILSNINKNNWKKICIISLICIAIACIGIIILLNIEVNNSSINWIKEGIKEIILFFKGEKTGYFDIVLNNFIGLPQGIDLVFGTGRNMFNGFSDVGFINDLWMGGIVLYILLYPGYLYLILSIKNENKTMQKLMRILGLFTFIIMNIKWAATQTNNVLNMYILIFIINNIEICKLRENVDIKKA